MKRLPLKAGLALVVLAVTVAFFVRYFVSHPAVGHELAHTKFLTLLLLIGLYFFSVVALAAITWATLRLCDLRLPLLESWLLTAYTAIVNFFGPLQSGPAFRGVYLKTKHNVNLKRYAAASLVYYFFYGLYSGLMLLSGLLHWWLVVLVVGAMIILIAAWQVPYIRLRLKGVNLRYWYYLAAATLLQVITILFIFYVELKNVAPATHFWQAIIYTGAANLAMFVSITPAAIGFRESFLVFSGHLHHVSGPAIAAASILDRAVYVSTLLLLAVMIFGSHARRRLSLKRPL